MSTKIVLWRAPSGRLHLLRSCTAAPHAITLSKVTVTAAELLAVPVASLCRCAWSAVEKAREGQPATAITCRVCHEPIRQVGRDWVHIHSGDRECWTGDGATAYPVDLVPTEDGESK